MNLFKSSIGMTMPIELSCSIDFLIPLMYKEITHLLFNIENLTLVNKPQGLQSIFF